MPRVECLRVEWNTRRREGPYLVVMCKNLRRVIGSVRCCMNKSCDKEVQKSCNEAHAELIALAWEVQTTKPAVAKIAPLKSNAILCCWVE